jgi:hypothetical protein
VTDDEIKDEIASRFLRAEQLCAEAYDLQRRTITSEDIAEARERQAEARRRRGATAFELLYCKLRDIADDWYREALRRQSGIEPGTVDTEYLEPHHAVASTIQLAYDRVCDWDY